MLLGEHKCSLGSVCSHSSDKAYGKSPYWPEYFPITTGLHFPALF